MHTGQDLKMNEFRKMFHHFSIGIIQGAKDGSRFDGHCIAQGKGGCCV